jgi:hypothetical protein
MIEKVFVTKLSNFSKIRSDFTVLFSAPKWLSVEVWTVGINDTIYFYHLFQFKPKTNLGVSRGRSPGSSRIEASYTIGSASGEVHTFFATMGPDFPPWDLSFPQI